MPKNILFSIIIPVYKDLEELKGLLPKIYEQEFDLEQIEIFVVENGQTERVKEYCENHTKVNYLVENEFLRSPYSCRNRGIESSSGEYLVFLDSTCHPIKTWLSSLETIIQNSGAHLIAGNVSFRFKNEVPTIAELIDSHININMEQSVLKKKVAKTANLAVKASVFSEIGLFEEGVRSGGDIVWTKTAVQAGFSLIYSKQAEVKKIARTYGELIQKQFRVGLGKSRINSEKLLIKQLVKAIYRILKPAKLSVAKNININTEHYSLISIYIVFYQLNLSLQLGNLIGIVRKVLK